MHAFNLDSSSLEKLLKGLLQYINYLILSVVGAEGVVKLIVRDKKNDTSNEYAVTVGETD